MLSTTSPRSRTRKRAICPAANTGARAVAATPPLSLSGVLTSIPSGLRDPLIAALNEITNNYRLGKWEPAELDGGKLCEVVYAILRGHVDGSFPTKPSKPSDMVGSCRAFEKATGFPQSVRITIPRVLIALYEIRNNRGVGHVGGDVNPNHMDATIVHAAARWIVAELIRLFHAVDTVTATQLVDSLVEREIPGIWTVRSVRRVLSTKLTMKEKTLLLLYGSAVPVSERDLARWIEHSNASVYRRDVLVPAHKDRLIEYDRDNGGDVHLSPLGSAWVESNLGRFL